MNVAIDLDQTITASRESIDFFSVLTNLLIPEHKIFIITNRQPNTEQDIADELDHYGIEYSEIVITDQKAKYIKDHNITIFFENEDEYFLGLGKEVTVFKIREEENYNFKTYKWYGDKNTVEMIDE